MHATTVVKGTSQTYTRLVQRCGLVVLLALALAVGVSSAAARVDWKSLKYFHYDLAGSELYLSTDKAWGGKVVQPLTSLPLGLVPRWALDAKRAPKTLWVPTCMRKAQTAVFSFPFSAPGPAETASVLIASAGLGTPAIDGVSVFVNGAEVARTDAYWRTRGYSEVTLDKSDLAALRYGANAIVVRATKPALPKVVKACNTANDTNFDKRRVGVAVGLRATFVADMQAQPAKVVEGFKVITVSAGTRRVYARATAGRSLAFNSNLTALNAGPAASVDGVAIVDLTAGSSLKMVVVEKLGIGGSAFGECTMNTQNLFHYVTVTCPYKDLAPKKTAVLKIPWVIKVSDSLAVNFSQDTAVLSWRVGGVDDEGTVNGMARLEIVLCGPNASDPGCKNAQ
jgi:hypothetical protein